MEGEEEGVWWRMVKFLGLQTLRLVVTENSWSKSRQDLCKSPGETRAIGRPTTPDENVNKVLEELLLLLVLSNRINSSSERSVKYTWRCWRSSRPHFAL